MCAAQRVLGHLRALVRRDVRELEAAVIAADRVAERPDAARGRLEMGVDARAAVEQRDARLGGSVSSTRGSRPVATSSASAVALPPIQQSSVPPGTSRARDARARSVTTRTPSCAQHAQQRLACLGLLAAQRRFAAQHHRDLDAEAVERLRELARDRPGAADDERCREVAAGEQVVARQVRGALDAGDRRDPRARAHGEHRGDAAQLGLAVLVARRRARRRGTARCPRTRSTPFSSSSRS